MRQAGHGAPQEERGNVLAERHTWAKVVQGLAVRAARYAQHHLDGAQHVVGHVRNRVHRLAASRRLGLKFMLLNVGD